MPKRNPYSFNKRIAQRRHLDTLYDKNIDLMYDKNGNPTQLRKLINYIIAKIMNRMLHILTFHSPSLLIYYARKSYISNPVKSSSDVAFFKFG